MKHEKSIFISIIAILLVLCASMAYSEERMNSLIPSSYSQGESGLLITVSNEGSVYKKKKKKILYLERSPDKSFFIQSYDQHTV